MTLSIIAIILSVLGLIFVWMLKNIVQSDMNGIRDVIDRNETALKKSEKVFLDGIRGAHEDIRAVSKQLRDHTISHNVGQSYTSDRDRIGRIADAIREAIALMDPPAHGFRIVCHRKRYYIEAVRFHDQGGAAFHTELDYEFPSFTEADAVVKALLEARSTKQKIVYHPVIIPKDDVC